MDLVLDANVLFAALIKDNVTAELMFKDTIHLFAPEYLLDEFAEHKEEIIDKTDRKREDFDRFIEILKKRITFHPYDDFSKCLDTALRITPDPDDAEYIALALSIKADIWSNDRSLKIIKELKVYSTRDIINILHEFDKGGNDH
ncbi:MAG: PIN domain-containing protein [Candidatus Thermoplasmatota archaeon]|nr:PIN domain-containing protein [Candidatus Thermoplasmatota archaeon]